MWSLQDPRETLFVSRVAVVIVTPDARVFRGIVETDQGYSVEIPSPPDSGWRYLFIGMDDYWPAGWAWAPWPQEVDDFGRKG